VTTIDDATIAQLIERAISWELAARDLYVTLSNSFPSHPEVEETWKQMAVDESRHASILRQTRDALPRGCLSRPLVATESALIDSVETELACAAMVDLRTLDDAYEVAHGLESSEVNTVFQILVSCHTEDLATSALLDAQFDEHLGRLKDLANRFDRSIRSSILLQT